MLATPARLATNPWPADAPRPYNPPIKCVH